MTKNLVAKIKKTDNSVLLKMWHDWDFHSLMVGMQNFGRRFVSVLNVNIHLLYDPVILFLGIRPRK